MAKVTNLNKFRKAATKADRQKQADENRVKFGRTKAEKLLSSTAQDKARRNLDGHKLDSDD